MYNICFDNSVRQYVVLSDHIAEDSLQYLNLTPIETAETEDDAYTKIASYKRTHEGPKAESNIIQFYNARKKNVKVKYDKELWENDRYFAFLIQEDFAPRVNKGFVDAFGTPLAASNYMRRLMWYMIDTITHKDTELSAIEAMMGSLVMLMTENNALEVGMIMFQFTEMLKCVSTLSETEQSRIEMVRDLVNPNKF